MIKICSTKTNWV
jgi:hypothetical protein